MKWTFSKSQHRLSHEPINGQSWSCEAHNEVIAGCTGCPLGTFPIGAPEYNEPYESDDLRSMGPYFIPLNNIPGHSGIGLHGGGSASPHPLAARQGFHPTENCIRLQNDDLYHVAQNVAPGDTLEVVA